MQQIFFVVECLTIVIQELQLECLINPVMKTAAVDNLSTWGQIFTAFSYWSLNSLFHWTFNSSSYWFSLSNCSLIQTLQL
ncbi:hypothetical protein T12_1940 [Trichinella patagoniensis]|uniref:Uncharacterized protein n=1 Tax=Trichinella patagoniensis TaxID=990121 RepID=A0A0V0Z0Y9_9BILA|nr:hypothetical protein T12_1940 [Trichinella patagoniensis]